MGKRTLALYPVIASVCMVFALTSCEQQEEPSQVSKSAPSPTVPGAQVTFSDKLPAVLAGLPPSPGGPCTVDRVNDSLAAAVNKVSVGSSLNMDGWAVDDKAVSVPKIVMVQLTSVRDNAKFYALASRGTKRPDVAQALNNSVYEDAGFDLKDTALSNVPAGRYETSIIQISGNTAVVCDSGRKLDIE